MKRQTELQKYRSLLMKDGMAHIIYRAADIHDIVHPFSVEGSELLTEEFRLFPEKYRGIIPENAPIVLEIVSEKLSKDDKELADKAIWSHFCLNMSEADISVKKCIRECFLYLLYTILSVILIFAVNSSSGEVITNLAYIPFWFFGYRLLIYAIIDCVPLWKDRKWYRQLASMKLIFTGFETADPVKTASEISEYELETEEAVQNRLVMRDVTNREIVTLRCRVNSLDDVIQMPQLRGREFLSPALAEYIGRAEAFFSTTHPITLELRGKTFTEEEQERIAAAVANYYALRVASEENDSQGNRRKIYLFTFFAAVSALALFFWGKRADAAWHEFVIMLLWFFGDYLLEFVLIRRLSIGKSRKILKNCRNMRLSFSSEK